ncbi:MAG: MMPL family transporter [Polyangiaceae bacterium]|nr:MMPL family transporter [Polyangiaceae bacterium]
MAKEENIPLDSQTGEPRYNAIARFIGFNPWLILSVSIVMTWAAMTTLYDFEKSEPRLQIDPSVNALLSRDSDDVAFYQAVKDEFGNENTVVAALIAEDPFSAAHVAEAKKIVAELELFKDVEEVRSLANSIDPQLIGEDVITEDFFDQREGFDTSPAALRKRALAHPLYSHSLVADDASGLALMVQIGNLSDKKFMRSNLDHRIRAVMEKHWTGSGVLVGGMPPVKAETSRLLVKTITRNLPAVFLMGYVIFAIAFRSLRKAIVPLVTIGISLTWTLAIMAWDGHQMNVVTTIVPILLLTLGFAYVMYMLSEHQNLAREKAGRVSHRMLVSQALQEVSLPIAMTALTTMAGFLALTVSPLKAIRDFGYYSAVGVVASALASVIVAPPLVSILGATKPPDVSRFSKFAGFLADIVSNRTRLVFIGSGIAGALALGGALQIAVDVDIVGNLSPTTQVRADSDEINRNYGGVVPFYVVIDAEEVEAFDEYKNLIAVREFQDWLEKQPETGDTSSLADFVRMLYVAFAGDESKLNRLPNDASLTAQLLMFVEPEERRPFIDEERKRATVLVRSKKSHSAELRSLIKRVETRLKQLPKNLKARVTGDTIMLAEAADDIARGQIEGLAIAFGAIFLILLAYLRSPALAGIVLVPNVFPVLFYFGLLGWSGTPLNNSTALLACVVLGIAVDDTIHFVIRYRREGAENSDSHAVARICLEAIGRPVTYTSVLLVAGLLILGLSDLKNLREFGVLGATTLAFAWVVDLTLTPALCVRFRIGQPEEAPEAPELSQSTQSVA